MSIITQDLINEVQNIIKKCFFTVSRDLLRPLLNNFLNTSITNAYLQVSINLKASLNNVVIKTLEMAIPLIDNYFLNSQHRKNYFYYTKLISRNITTIFGELSFSRYYYTDKSKKNGFFLIDELFNFEKYKFYDPIVRAIFIDRSVNYNANNTSNNTNILLDKLKEYLKNKHFNDIPRQTIYRWIKDWNIPKVEYNLIENVKELYVMVDEKWIHEQIRLSELSEEEKGKRHYIMSKCFVTFANKETKNKRSTLLNRHVFMTTSSKPWQDFMNEIYNIYNFEEIDKIYLLSDAGSWILSGKGELKLFQNNEVIVNTCEFHVKEYINRLSRSKEKRKLLVKYIYEDEDKEAFIKLANEIIDNAKNKEYKLKHKNYIINHWQTILNMKDREIKSSMESHISHCIANKFGSRPKGYSKHRIESYLKLEETKQNGINIMDLYLNSYNKCESDKYIYNQKDVSFSIFEKDTSIIPSYSSSNPISILLNNIAYDFSF